MSCSLSSGLPLMIVGLWARLRRGRFHAVVIRHDSPDTAGMRDDSIVRSRYFTERGTDEI